jgi:hypothetical protein
MDGRSRRLVAVSLTSYQGLSKDAMGTVQINQKNFAIQSKWQKKLSALSCPKVFILLIKLIKHPL